MIRNICIALIVALSSLILQAQEPLTFRQKSTFNQQVILESMYKAKAWQEAQHEGPVPTNWLTGCHDHSSARSLWPQWDG